MSVCCEGQGVLLLAAALSHSLGCLIFRDALASYSCARNYYGRCGISRLRAILKMFFQCRMQPSEIIKNVSNRHPESEGEELCFPAGL